jgi:hypothetical protein
MKYAKMIINIIDCDTQRQSKLVSISIPKINRYATRISFSLRERENVGYDNFYIKTSTHSSVVVLYNEIWIPWLRINEQGDAMVESNFETAIPCVVSNVHIGDCIGNLVKSLYYWDKRCQRSVNVKIKQSEDLPLEIVFNDNKVSIPLEQMKTFAEFIKNN